MAHRDLGRFGDRARADMQQLGADLVEEQVEDVRRASRAERAQAIGEAAAREADLAPSASARTTSRPPRMPESISTVARDPTAETIAGSTSIDAGAPSKWRPP